MPSARGVLHSDYAAARKLKPAVRFRYRVRARMVLRSLREHGDPDQVERVLDLGCAEGRTLLELRSRLRAREMVGIEASRDLIAKAPPLPAGVRIEEGDVTRLPSGLETAGFDLVTALAVLEHLPEPTAAVREAARVLRPGGLFVATCPEPRWDVLATRLRLLEGGQHEAELGRDSLSRLVAEAGLELLAYRRFMWAPVAVLPYLRVPVPPGPSLELDAAIRRLRVFDALFVNQCVVARRPSPAVSGASD